MTRQNINVQQSSLNKRIETLSKLSDLYGAFMKVQRATYRDGRPETDGEHTLHAMFLAVAYTAQYHPEFDPGEVALLMMIHDLDEVYAGDVNSLMADTNGMRQKEVDEERDRHRLRVELVDSPFILRLLERYWAQEEPITKYVRAIEKFDPSFAHKSDGGAAIRAMGIKTRQQYRKLDERAVDRMAGYAPADIIGIRRLLGGQVAEATFNTV
jgi:5'-deoxynucleotidase YfbR-like HD superfamily hydrolase